MICRICDADGLTPVLDLGDQPWANNFLTGEQCGKEESYPLRLEFCSKCGCVQLDYTVPKEVMFADHTYVSGTTKTLANHFLKTAEYVDDLFTKDRRAKSILDIGSNDGTQLKQYKKIGFDVLGVESCRKIAEMAITDGIPTEIDYFNDTTVKRLNRKFDIVNASGVFFHLEELHSATKGVKAALAEDGVFVVQFLYMKKIVENLAFDQIYHEHLLYYSLTTLNKLLNRHGLELFDGYVAPIHGGSVVAFVTHTGKRSKSARLQELLKEEEEDRVNTKEYYLEFAKRVERMREETLSFLRKKASEGKLIYGMGAPVKGNTFLNYCKIGTDLVQKLVEKNPLRKGLFSPGMHIPIELEDELDSPPDVYLVLAWNFKEEILKNNQALLDRGVEFYFPVDPARDSEAKL